MTVIRGSGRRCWAWPCSDYRCVGWGGGSCDRRCPPSDRSSGGPDSAAWQPDRRGIQDGFGPPRCRRRPCRSPSGRLGADVDQLLLIGFVQAGIVVVRRAEFQGRGASEQEPLTPTVGVDVSFVSAITASASISGLLRTLALSASPPSFGFCSSRLRWSSILAAI